MCANVFIHDSGKFLVLKRSEQKRYAPGFLHPVGGKIDLNEDPYTAAVREVREETGLAVKDLTLKAVINELAPPPDRSYNWLIFHFIAEYDGGEVATTDEGELVWLEADQIKAAQLFPSVRPLIGRILDPNAPTAFATFGYTETDEIDMSGAIVRP
jgi:8-oxo-dGTP diphosphatase